MQSDDSERHRDGSHNFLVEAAPLFPDLYILVYLFQRSAVPDLGPPEARGGEESAQANQ
jgi:hypothetical protein